jgi:hypothetical protein
MSTNKAKRIAAAILADVTDRRGWSQEWDGFDEEIQEEIVVTWEKIIDKHLKDGKCG